jgi:NADPH:quinone reductase-like Zn-dependent oxidoreductase
VRAAVSTSYGPPDVVRVTEVAKPAPGASQLLVKVSVTTVNQTDAHYRSGRPWIMRPLLSGLTRPKVSVLGCEFAGQVEAAGSAVTSFQPGQRVFGYVEGPFGGHAEYLIVGADGNIAAVPDRVSDEQAAAATEGSHYALSHLHATGVTAGQDVLVYGATGAIGTAAVQLAKVLGARVTAVCATPHVELVRGLGADKVVDYLTSDFAVDALRYDVVFDAAGKTSYRRCKRLLKSRGRYTSTGPGPGYRDALLPLVTAASRGRKVVFSYPRISQETVQYLGRLMESGQFTPVIDRSYPLDQIADAYRYVETHQKIGNVVIVVGSTAQDEGAGL